MKILVVCQRYYPEHFQVTEICEQMVKDGHQITVLTGLPNYPEGEIFKDYRNGKRRNENINGVKIVRSFEIGRGKSLFRLGINYLSFIVSSILKIRKFKDNIYDCIFVYQTSPVFMACAGVYYKIKNKIPFFIYCCDIWPECVKIYVKSEKSIIFRIVKIVSTRIYQSADEIAVQSRSFFGYFEKVHKIKIDSYIPQFGNDDYLGMDLKSNNSEVNFVFTGNIGRAQRVDLIIEAAEIIREMDFKVHFVGSGSCYSEAVKIVKDKKLNNKIIFHGKQPYEKMPFYYKKADVCIATLNTGTLIDSTIPAKIQGYFAAGKPVLAAMIGDVKEIIDETKSGLCVKPNDVKAFAMAMKYMIENKSELSAMGTRAKKYYEENFTKKIFMNNLYSFIKVKDISG